MTRTARVVPKLLLLLLLLLLPLLGAAAGLGTVPALASAAGMVAGRAVNGTADGVPPAAAEVVLHAFRGGAHADDRQSQTAADGSFAFDAVETVPDATYQITATYAGVTYASEAVSFGPGETAKQLIVTVYEATQIDPGLRVRRASLILTGVDAATRTMQAVELVALENPGDRTYLPSATGPAGPMGLLRFPLPPEAGNLEPGPGLDEFELVQVDRGFATSLPVPPAGREVLFRYWFPFQPGQMRLTRSVPYPTAELQILVGPDVPSLTSPELQPVAPLQLGARTYRVYLARDLPAGSQVELTLGGLPGRWPLSLPLDTVPASVWGGLGAALALSLVAGYGWRARRAAPALHAVVPEHERWTLAAEVAALDDAFAAGQLAAESYSARRAQAKERLRDLVRRQPSGVAERVGDDDRIASRQDGTSVGQRAAVRDA